MIKPLLFPEKEIIKLQYKMNIFRRRKSPNPLKFSIRNRVKLVNKTKKHTKMIKIRPIAKTYKLSDDMIGTVMSFLPTKKVTKIAKIKTRFVKQALIHHVFDLKNKIFVIHSLIRILTIW